MPVKKEASLRARTNRASTAATLSASPRRKAAPKLPDIRVWTGQTLLWWRDMWSSPMSSEYHTVDLHQLFVLAVLMDDFYLAVSPSLRRELSAEIRLHRKDFGVTPYDRRRLEWTIEQVADAQDKAASRRKRTTAPAPTAKNDPRQLLRAVE